MSDLVQRMRMTRLAWCGDKNLGAVAQDCDEAADEIERLQAEVQACNQQPGPRWWRCDTHGQGKRNEWGCPNCVRELRAEVQALNTNAPRTLSADVLKTMLVFGEFISADAADGFAVDAVPEKIAYLAKLINAAMADPLAAKERAL